MQLVNVEQNTQEWLDARQGVVTGSKALKMITKRGNSIKDGFYEHIAEQLAIEAEYEDPMERGHRLEPDALEAYAEKTGKKVEKGKFYKSDDHARLGLSPDGVISDEEMVEVKCLKPSKHIRAWHEMKNDDLWLAPKEYVEQILHYFVVNDKLKKLHVVLYCPELTAIPLLARTVTRDRVETQVEFQKNYLLAKIELAEELINELSF